MTYSTEQQTQIIKMKSEGKSSRKIANELGLSKSGVNDFLARVTKETEYLMQGENGKRLLESLSQIKVAKSTGVKLEGGSPLIRYVNTIGMFGNDEPESIIIPFTRNEEGELGIKVHPSFVGYEPSKSNLGRLGETCSGQESPLAYTLSKLGDKGFTDALEHLGENGIGNTPINIVNHVDDCRKVDKGLEQLLFANTEAKTWKDMQNWYKDNVLEKDPTRKGQSFDYIIEDDLEYEALQKEDNSVILFISDMHIPYHHKNLIPFLKELKEKYKPTRVICLGDECDMQSLSFHDSDPDLMSAGDELKEARKVIKQVEELFPIMDLVDSNHGSLAYRKAKHHGIPQHFIKGYNEVLEVGEGWKWHNDLTIKLPNGEDVYICHGKAVRGVQLSQNMGMSVVQGHHHSEFNVHYWANPKHLHFSLQAGCLIDDKSLAMAYNKLTLKRPIIGTALIVNGIPVLEAMPL